MIAEIVKTVLIPGSVEFLLLGLSFGVALLYRGKSAATWGRRWLTFLAAIYLVLALPVVSNVLIAGIEPDIAPLETPANARGARVLAVVGNGVATYAAPNGAIHQMARRTAFAVLEGARLYHLLRPEWVIASGGIPSPASQHQPESVVIRDELVALGVPAERVVLESDSRNTEDQMANIAALSRERHWSPIVVVTTPAHARRVQLLAGRAGMDIVLAASDALRYDDERGGWRNWIPGTDALRGSESAMYEYIAVVYAWVTGGHDRPAVRPT